MKSIAFVPGHVVSPAVITLPTEAPSIDAVVSARILRIPSALSAHSVTQPTITHANVIAAIEDHAHDQLYKANPAANAVTMAANSLHNASAGDLTVVGAGADGGILSKAAVAKAGGPQNCAGAAVAAHTGTNPVLNPTPYKDTARTFHLSLDTELGDLLALNYFEVGERVLVS